MSWHRFFGVTDAASKIGLYMLADRQPIATAELMRRRGVRDYAGAAQIPHGTLSAWGLSGENDEARYLPAYFSAPVFRQNGRGGA